MPRALRILAITIGLLLVGVALGALAAVGSLELIWAGYRLACGGAGRGMSAELDRFAAIVGAVVGGVLAPLAMWSLLRRVPLGRAFLGMFAGTVVGGIVGWFAPSLGHGEVAKLFIRPTLGAAVGFAIAVGLLRRYGEQ